MLRARNDLRKLLPHVQIHCARMYRKCQHMKMPDDERSHGLVLGKEIDQVGHVASISKSRKFVVLQPLRPNER